MTCAPAWTRRAFLRAISAAAVTTAAPMGAQTTGPARAPADAWPQFRGTPSLTGHSATTIAAEPKLAWTWEGGESIESCPVPSSPECNG